MFEVHLTAGCWWLFRGSPLTFPLAGPYGSEAEAATARERLLENPLRVAEILSIDDAA